MTSVSKHINEMKEEYDADVYVRGLDNLIKGCEVRMCILLPKSSFASMHLLLLPETASQNYTSNCQKYRD